MAVAVLEGFQSFPTHHCVTGSMALVYAFNGHPISEDMLLGIGAGVGFSYWHFKGQPPFIGGRGNVGVGNQEGLEKTAGRRTGVTVDQVRTSSARKAAHALLELLSAGQPVMLAVDMGYLPYFDFGGHDYHFGGHVVVACGYDPESRTVTIADRDGLHIVRMDVLAQARGSKHKPFPPENQWTTFDFTGKRLPTAEEVRQAIIEQAHAMLEPPIRNIGVAGIRKAAKEVPGWSKSMAGDELCWALFNCYIFISPVGGSGGGNFRYMFSRFLGEAAILAEEPRLAESAVEFRDIADGWAAVGEWFRRASGSPEPAACLAEAQAPLRALAEKEEAAWQRLQEIAGN